MPGFGHADKLGDFTYTVEGYGRFLEAALEELEVRRAHLVLHDFGGPWGLEWASRNSNRLASAVLINTGAGNGHSTGTGPPTPPDPAHAEKLSESGGTLPVIGRPVVVLGRRDMPA